MNEYLVIIEPADDGSFSAYVPDLPGCVSCGDTVEDVTQSIREAIAFHIEGILKDGQSVPQPKTLAARVKV